MRADMRIAVLAWVEPTDAVMTRIREEYPTGQVELIEWAKVSRAVFRFVREQAHQCVHAFYFLCEDLGKSGQVPYLLALALLLKARRKKLIDLNCIEQSCSWASFLSKGMPRILLGVLWDIGILLMNWAALKVLDNRFIMRCIRVDSGRNVSENETPIPKRIGFFWAITPSNVINMRVGGEISHVVGFLGGLKRVGYEAFLVSTRPIPQSSLPASNQVDNEVVDERNLPAWPGEIREMAYNWKLLWKARGLIRRWHPSLIYHRSSIFSYIGVLLSVLYRIPLVVEFNSSDVWEAKNAGGSRFSRILELTEKVSLAYAVKVAVVSDEVRNAFLSQGVSSDRIIVNPNGVDPEVFRPSGEERKAVANYDLSGKVIVGFLGVFLPYHGILTLARAIKSVVREIESVHFLIVGDGILRPDFESIVRLDSVSSHVTITGKVPHESVPDLLDACDILVSPHQNMADGSPFFGSPTKIFEYMAMAKAIVASNVGQLGQILEHEETALLVRPEDPEDLARGIVRLGRDSTLRETLGRKARKRVVESYTWEKNALRILGPVLGEGETAR